MREDTRFTNLGNQTNTVGERGMSAQDRFFDETTETVRISAEGVVLRTKNLLQADGEVHLNNLNNSLSGTFRVVWVNSSPRDGFYLSGVEPVEVEGDLWKFPFASISFEREGSEDATPWLRCSRCRQKEQVCLPEVEPEFLGEGFSITRLCDSCRGTTVWEFHVGEEEDESSKSGSPEEDRRRVGGAPLNFMIKVIHFKYGSVLEDIRTTLNVSRGGAYFHSHQNYEPGDDLKVVLPYEEGQMEIKLPA